MAETLEQNRTTYDERVQRIRANRDLSEEAKRRKMAEAYREALDEHQRIAAEDRATLERRVAEAERKVFGISCPAQLERPVGVRQHGGAFQGPGDRAATETRP